MGVFSKYHRYREAGEDVNVYNAESFGEPEYSLFTSAKVFSLHRHIEITDAAGNVVYTSRSKVISLHDKTDIFDAYGERIAHVERKLFSIHDRHFVTMSDGDRFELSNELFHIYKSVMNIVGLNWQLRGNIWGMNFQLYDGNGDVIAVICQKMISIHDKYCIDIYRPQYEKQVIAILITLQHIIADRENAAAAASSN